MARLCLVLGVSLLAAAGNGQGQTTLRDSQFRVNVNLVTLRFVVRDSQGKLLNQLTQEEFRVFENDAPEPIAFFRPPRNREGRIRKLQLAFLIDISGSTFATRGEEIAAARTFLDNIHQFTQVGVFGFTDHLIPFQDFTSERRLAVAALSSARQHLGQTAIYESLDALLERITPTGGVQHAIIIISDGVDPAYQRYPGTIALAQRKHVALYTILVPSAAQLYIGPTGQRLAEEEEARLHREEAFAALAAKTGGLHFSGFEAILNFGEVMAQINDDLFGNLYSLGYYTQDPSLSRSQRRIRIEVLESDARISTPFENQPDQLAAKKEFIAALFNTQSSPLGGSSNVRFHELGVDLDLLPSRREGGKVGLPFRLKISPYSLRAGEGGGVRSQIGVVGLLLDAQGTEVVRLREIVRVRLSPKELREGRGIIYTNKLLAPPGNYTLKLAVLEIPSWKMSSFEGTVRVGTQ